MADGSRAKRELRRAVGRALRDVRERGAFSLDDLAGASNAEGVSVSRSHLSRVENGEADISLPRFLVLMRVLGESRETVLDDLDARIAAGETPLDALFSEASKARRRHEHERVSERLSAAFVVEERSLEEHDLEAWARAEAALGRWRSSARICQLRLSRRSVSSEGRALLQAAAALLGAGQTRAALAFARAALPHAESAARVVEGASLLALGSPELCLDRLDGVGGAGSDPDAAGIALVVATHAYLALERERAALQASQSALSMQLGELARAEARIALAYAEGACRRPRGGLRSLTKALPFARAKRLIELSVRTQRIAAALHRQAGDMEAARTATRAMRALARRVGSDRKQGSEPGAAPLQGLFEIAGQGAEAASPRRD